MHTHTHTHLKYKLDSFNTLWCETDKYRMNSHITKLHSRKIMLSEIFYAMYYIKSLVQKPVGDTGNVSGGWLMRCMMTDFFFCFNIMFK